MTKLEFKDNEGTDFIHKKGYFLSAFLHNEDNRVTIVKHGYGSMTFERYTDDKGETAMWLKYFIDSQICQPIKVRTVKNELDLYILSELVSPDPE